MTSIETAAVFAPIIAFAVLMGLGNIYFMVREAGVRRS